MTAPDYRLALLDFDGTLADTYRVFVSALEHVVRQHGLRAIPPEELEAFRSQHGRMLMQRLGVSWWSLPAVAASMMRAVTAARHEIRLFPGIAQALHQLDQAGVTLAIVSTNSEDNVRAVLGDAAGLVRFYECGAGVFGKRAKFLRVLRRSGIDRRQAVAVGDELRDLEAARQARIDFAGVAWGFTTAEALAGARPRMMIDAPQSLARALVAVGP